MMAGSAEERKRAGCTTKGGRRRKARRGEEPEHANGSRQ